MIYNNKIKALLMYATIINGIILGFAIGQYIFFGYLVLVSIVEILCFLFFVNKVKNIIWLQLDGISTYINIEDIITNAEIMRSRTGSSMHVTISTKDRCYKGSITIPYACYSAFLEALQECDSVEVKMDPGNQENYYMCLEKVAAHRWIPNSCKIVSESKYKTWFWISINAIMMVLGLIFSI